MDATNANPCNIYTGWTQLPAHWWASTRDGTLKAAWHRTFGEYANVFASTVFKMGAKYQRIDVVFDRYQDESVKAGTWTKRKQRHRPVRRKA